MNQFAEMKIAVDARPLCHPGTGIYRYTRELLTRMCAMGGLWYLYSPQPYDRAGLVADNIVHRTWNVPSYAGGSQASQLLFPWWVREDKVSTFWGPRHHLPLCLPGHVTAVLTVHDLVWQKHGSSMRLSRRWAERLLMPRSVRRADKLVTVTNYIADQLKDSFTGVGSRLRVIHSASCFESLSPDTGDPMDLSRYFLFVGTMEPRKNLPRVLQAYRSYAGKLVARDLKIVGGGGWGGIDPNRLVADLGLTEKVQVMGSVSDERLVDLYRGAYALVMPSLYEGFGLPVVEAMQYGVPSIVSRDSALSEVAAGAGLEVDPLSEDAICAAFCALTDDSARYARLRAAALLHAGNFSWNKSAAQMFTLLRNTP